MYKRQSNTAPEKDSLIWIADNGKTYALGANIPVSGITNLTLGVKEKDESGMAVPGITLTAHPQSVTVKEGQSASFAVQAVSEHGLGTLGYSWEVKQPQAARDVYKRQEGFSLPAARKQGRKGPFRQQSFCS